MTQFDEEGIQKLTGVLGGGLQGLLKQLQEVTEADRSYTAFDGANVGGSVKLIIETAGIG